MWDESVTLAGASPTFTVHDLGVQNASWIIPILREYEALMSQGVESALPRA